ncbi:NAD(P)/FAD-dependent oxidoreductase [Arcticibacter sp. MXS-1]|uniref:NAD(P)/FAD-dependent oxidoreductase n=1 Tax=Arcticibacter sp. MXS-1 TaxID=3341726 RepID=UPI0035A87BAE
MTTYDVIIAGGSYAGLSAAMALGRARRKVLVVDSGKPCNRFTPHSHNFLTQDGRRPAEIAQLAKEQVLQYPTVEFEDAAVVDVIRMGSVFKVSVNSGKIVQGEKLILAAGIRDLMPAIQGFADCWGKSILHCPYCHGYEVRDKATGILANGEMAFELARLISNWTSDLTVLTNGKATLTSQQMDWLNQRNIRVLESEIAALEHEHGLIRAVSFTDGSVLGLEALYARPAFELQVGFASKLDLELTEQGLIKVDGQQRTSQQGVFAAGDSSILMRSVASAVASGNLAGAMANKDLIEERFA